MIYINAFLLCGSICLIGQLLYEYTNHYVYDCSIYVFI